MHWTAGAHAPSFYNRQFYHYLVDGEGNVHKGHYESEANLDTKDGKYAAHCGGGNTGAIGVAMCAMAGFVSPCACGRFPIKKVQLEAFLALCARLSTAYNIPITPKPFSRTTSLGSKTPKPPLRARLT